jgi:ribosomal protein L37E
VNYPLLTIYADLLDDLERSRIATENRIRSLRDVKGLAGSPEEERLDAIAMGLAVAEKQAVNELRKAVKAHPLGPWISAQVGVGEKQAGRLLGVLGDPAYRFDHVTGEMATRSVSQLWSYCGYGDASRQRRRRGEKANWNADLKMRAFLIAESCIKQVGKGSPYRAVYDEARAKYADAVHADECRRCGPSGSPAPAGSPLNDGHKHARAIRAVAKAFLRDLWIEARRIHSCGDTQRRTDPARDLQEAP